MGQSASRQEAFWECCSYGRVHKVKEFINGGIDVDWVSHVHDCCPIHVASQGKPEIVDLLISANCNVNVRDIRGNSALHHAAMKGHADIVQKLIKAGSDINCQDKNGWTPLHCACYWCHREVVEVLLSYSCDVFSCNKDGRTALHETARSPESDENTLSAITSLLLEAGSDKDMKSCDLGEADFTPLMYSAYHSHPGVSEVLIEAGCQLDTCDTNGWTALHWAADRMSDQVVYILLKAGSNAAKRGSRGELAVNRAKKEDVKVALFNAYNLCNKMATMDDDPLINHKISPDRSTMVEIPCFDQDDKVVKRRSKIDLSKSNRPQSQRLSSDGDGKLGAFLNGFKVTDAESADRLHQVASLVEQVSIAQHPEDKENALHSGTIDALINELPLGNSSDIIENGDHPSNVPNGVCDHDEIQGHCLETNPVTNLTSDAAFTDRCAISVQKHVLFAKRESCSTIDSINSSTSSLSSSSKQDDDIELEANNKFSELLPEQTNDSNEQNTTESLHSPGDGTIEVLI